MLIRLSVLSSCPLSLLHTSTDPETDTWHLCYEFKNRREGRKPYKTKAPEIVPSRRRETCLLSFLHMAIGDGHGVGFTTETVSWAYTYKGVQTLIYCGYESKRFLTIDI